MHFVGLNKDIEIRKFEIVVNTQFLLKLIILVYVLIFISLWNSFTIYWLSGKSVLKRLKSEKKLFVYLNRNYFEN